MKISIYNISFKNREYMIYAKIQQRCELKRSESTMGTLSGLGKTDRERIASI